MLNPAPATGCDSIPPTMQAQQANGFWTVEGTYDRNLIDQAIETITTNALLFQQAELSAAP